MYNAPKFLKGSLGAFHIADDAEKQGCVPLLFALRKMRALDELGQ